MAPYTNYIRVRTETMILVASLPNLPNQITPNNHCNSEERLFFPCMYELDVVL